MLRFSSAVLVAASLSVSAMVSAQGAPRAPRADDRAPVAAPRGGQVTAILNARRQLDLTPRQVAQLDSIERTVFAERQRVAQEMQPMRQRLRQQDSTATAAAQRLLSDAQRSTWRELQAERRGFVRGARAGRGAHQMRGARAGHGAHRMHGARAGRGAHQVREPRERRPD